MKEKHYSKIKDLIPGMIVADNIYDGNNHLIIPIGTKITDKLILRLGFYDIDNVLVWDKISSIVSLEAERSTILFRDSLHFSDVSKNSFRNF